MAGSNRKDTPEEVDSPAGRYSARGKKIGRPQVRFEPLRLVPTRCPAEVLRYLKGLAVSKSMSLTKMYEHMIRQFVQERPWEHGLLWRKPKVTMMTVGGAAGTTGWVQTNLQLPQDLADALDEVAKSNGISKASAAYTAMFWWCQYIFPPRR